MDVRKYFYNKIYNLSSIGGFTKGIIYVKISYKDGSTQYTFDKKIDGTELESSNIDVIVLAATISEAGVVLKLDVLEMTIDLDNGIVIINLPALKIFRGTHDIVVGIKCRFSKKLIKELFSSTEFSIKEMYYWPFLLSSLILLVRLFQKIKMFFKKDINITSDLRQYSNLINSVLFRLNKIERQVFKNIRFYGSSIFVYAQKIYK